jgi:hypothetical protein
MGTNVNYPSLTGNKSLNGLNGTYCYFWNALITVSFCLRSLIMMKESLTSDGQIVHQYQHDEQSPPTLNR